MKEAQRYVDAAEFGEWKAYDRLNPIGWERFDMLAALVAMVTNNVWSKKARDLDDFTIKWGPKRRLTVAEICKKGEAYLATLPEGMVVDGSNDRKAGSNAQSSDG